MSKDPFEIEDGFILVHTIEISIGLKEANLTKEQRNICNKADIHPEADHPLGWGCETLADHIENVAAAHFSYLGDGSVAVKICIDNGLNM